MTTPNLDFNTTTQADLAENIVMPADLGTALQDHSENRYAQQTGNRYPGAIEGTLAGSPIGTGVLGIVNKMAAKLTSQVANADPADIRTASDLQPLVPGFFDLPLQDLFAPLLNALNGVGGGVLGGALSGIADLFSGRWAQVDDHEDAIGDLQDKTQVLEGVIGYGCRYMSSSPGVNTSASVMPFNTQVGPAVGVDLIGGGRFQLKSKGLWRLEAQCYFQTASLAPPRCYMDIVVRTPGGSEFARLKAMGSTDQGLTVTNVMPVVVPAADYTVEVQAWTSGLPLIGGSWRSIGGGLGTTRFSVFKISDETE